MKISHEPYRSCKKNSEVVLDKLAEYDELVEKSKEVGSFVSDLLKIWPLIDLKNVMEFLCKS